MHDTHPPTIPSLNAFPRPRVDQVSLRLIFSAFAPRTLDEIEFYHSGTGKRCRSRRGNTPGAFENIGTFRWSNAVRGLGLLLVRHSLAQRMGEPTYVLRGGPGSVAAALDSAINKPPAWLRSVFGIEQSSSPLMRTLFKRKRSDKTRNAELSVSCGFQLHAHNIEIRCGNVIVTDITALTSLAQELEQSALAQPEAGTPSEKTAGAPISPSKFSSYAVTRTGLRSAGKPGPQLTVDPSVNLDDPEQLKHVLATIAAQIGAAAERGLTIYAHDAKIRVLNENGDAAVMVRMRFGNLSKHPVLEHSEQFWFESPIDDISYKAYVNDQPVAGHPIRFEPHLKEFLLVFSNPIEPGGVVDIRHEFFVPSFFKERQFFFSRNRIGTVRPSVELLFEPPLKISSAVVTSQQAADRTVASGRSTTDVKYMKSDNRVYWQLHAPTPGGIVRTYWFYE